MHRAMQVAKVRAEAEKDLPTLTKAELAELLFEQVGLNKREAKDMVETFFDEIRNALERGEAVMAALIEAAKVKHDAKPRA